MFDEQSAAGPAPLHPLIVYVSPAQYARLEEIAATWNATGVRQRAGSAWTWTAEHVADICFTEGMSLIAMIERRRDVQVQQHGRRWNDPL